MTKKEIIKIIHKFINNESIAFDLIQEYGNEQFESDLIKCADYIIYQAVNNNVILSKLHKGVVAVALTMIALKYYDGNMWDHIRESFIKTYDGDFNVKADAKIRSMLQLFKKDCNYKNPDSLIAVPLISAGVTHYWLPSFFDFCFAIYKENLLARREIDENEVVDELQSTFETMRVNNHLSESEDYIKVGSSKSYKLSKFTQSALLTGTNSEGLSFIGAYCIRCIIKYVNKEHFKVHPYYEDAFEKRKSHFESDEKEKVKLIDTGNWKVRLKFVNDEIYLITKTEKVPETIDPNLIKLLVLENGNIVDEINDINVTFGIGGFIVGSKMIRLNCNILNNVSYRIVCDDKVLFDSYDKIYKDKKAYFFDEYGDQIEPGYDYTGSLVCITNTEPKCCERHYFKNNYCVSIVDIVPSGDYVFDNVHYAFKTIRKPGIEGEKCGGIYIKTSLDNKKFELYKNVSALLIETRIEKNQMYVVIDGKKYNFNEFEIVEFPELDNGVWQFKLLLSSLKNGMHVISINSLENNKPINKCTFKFIVDNEFRKSYEKKKDGFYYIQINSSFLDFESKINPGETSFETICVIPGRGVAKMTIYPEIIFSSLDMGSWFESEKRININDISIGNPVLYLTGSADMTAIASTNEKSYVLDVRKSKLNEEVFEVNIGPLLFLKSSDVLCAKLHIENKYNKCLINIDFATYIDIANSKFDYDEKKDLHLFKVSFIKTTQVICSIVDMATGCVNFTKSIEPNVYFYPYNLKAFNSYKIVFKEKSGGMFAKERVIAEIPYFFSNTAELVGNVFEVCSVEYLNKNFEFVRKDIFSKTTLKFLKINKYDTQTFVGTLQRIGEYKENELKLLGYLKIATESEFEGENLWVYITDLKDDDLLLFDENNNEIYRTNDFTYDKNARKMPGIERFLIKHL